MIYKIACLTPLKHLDDIYNQLELTGDVTYEPEANYKQACELAKIADVIFVNPNKLTYKLDYNLLNDSNLKVIATASTGTNHIDLKAADQFKIKVLSLTKEMDVIERISSTAELAFGLTLALIRNIPKAFAAAKRGEWDYQPFIGRQLNALIFGVIGYGRLGKKYKQYANAFGAKTYFNDPNQSASMPLTKLLAISDVVSLHVHLNNETYKMVNHDFVSKCEKKPYIINTSRGDVVDENAIIYGLENSLISGYATDVISDELSGDTANSKIIEASKTMNIIVTPHIGGMTKEAQEIAYGHTVSMLANYLHAIERVV